MLASRLLPAALAICLAVTPLAAALSEPAIVRVDVDEESGPCRVSFALCAVRVSGSPDTPGEMVVNASNDYERVAIAPDAATTETRVGVPLPARAPDAAVAADAPALGLDAARPLDAHDGVHGDTAELIRATPKFTLATRAIDERAPRIIVGLDVDRAEAATDVAAWRAPPRERPDGDARGAPARHWIDTLPLPGPRLPPLEAPPLARDDALAPDTIVRAEGDAPARSPPDARGDGTATRAQPRAGLAVAAAIAAGALLALLAFLLYARITSRDAILKSPHRARLVALVEAHPGLSVASAAEELGLGRTAVLHHARVLQRAKLIRIERTRGHCSFFPPGAATHVAGISRRFWDHPVAGRILQLARSAGGVARQDIHEALADVPQRTRNHHLRALVAAGALLARDDGRLLVPPQG